MELDIWYYRPYLSVSLQLYLLTKQPSRHKVSSVGFDSPFVPFSSNFQVNSHHQPLTLSLRVLTCGEHRISSHGDSDYLGKWVKKGAQKTMRSSGAANEALEQTLEPVQLKHR